MEPITELQRCLALVRPVGMNDSAARDWLAAAAAEVQEFAHYRPTQFQVACKAIRQTATHHGQIVPGILAKQFYEWEIADGRHRHGLAAICGGSARPAIEHRGGGARQIGHYITPEELAEMKAERHD